MEMISTRIQPFFDWLLHSTLQISIIICLILLVQVVLRNRLSARWHYALWLILIIRMVMPIAPQSRFSIFNFTTPQSKTEAPGYALSESMVTPPEPIEDSSTASQENANTTTQRSLKLSTFLPLIWLAGALALGCYIIICNFNLSRTTSKENPSTDKEMLELLEECKSEIKLRTIVTLILTEKVSTPILMGFIRPRLLVPKSIMNELTREQLRYIFLHELAHVKRHDIALGWLTAVLQILHWFNPLVWFAFYRMRASRELACDAFVLSHTRGQGKQDYGRAIVTLLENFSVPKSLPGLAGILESKSQLKRRITMITKFKKNSYRWSPLPIVLIAILACISLADSKPEQSAEIPSTYTLPKEVPSGLLNRPWPMIYNVKSGTVTEKEWTFSSGGSSNPIEYNIKVLELSQRENGERLPFDTNPDNKLDYIEGMDTSKLFSCRSWITFEKNRFTVDPNSSKKVKLKIDVPDDSIGSYFACIVHERKYIRDDNMHLPIQRTITPVILQIEDKPLEDEIAMKDIRLENSQGTTMVTMVIENQGRTFPRFLSTCKIWTLADDGQWRFILTHRSIDWGVLPGMTVVLKSDIEQSLPTGKYKIIGEFYMMTDGTTIKKIEKEIDYQGKLPTPAAATEAPPDF